MSDLKWEVFATRGIPIVTRDRPVGVQETFFQAMASTLIVMSSMRTGLKSFDGL